MTVLDRPPELERAGLLEPPEALEAPGALEAPEAIFPEARRRQRRRRVMWTVATAAIAGALLFVICVVLWSERPVLDGSHSRLTPGARRQASHAPAVVVAWGDYAGVLHLGDLTTGRQTRIATGLSGGASGGPVVENHGRLLWVDSRDRVRSVEIATGHTRTVARGLAVIASPDGDRLYVDQGTRDFLELDARTLQRTGRVAMPAGWKSSPWVAAPVAGGLILMHTTRHSLVLGIWRPGNKVRPLGAAASVVSPLAVYTARNGRYSRVAWVPACPGHTAGIGSSCPLAITNTATGRTVKVASPNRYGFTGGAFSPDGRELATFVNTDDPTNPDSTPRSELAIIDTTTGAMRLDPKTNMVTTEDAAWVLWLPPGSQLLTGAISATYLVNAHSLLTRPRYFDGSLTLVYSVMGSPDLNFSTIVVPASALSLEQRRSLGLGTARRRSG